MKFYYYCQSSLCSRINQTKQFECPSFLFLLGPEGQKSNLFPLTVFRWILGRTVVSLLFFTAQGRNSVFLNQCSWGQELGTCTCVASAFLHSVFLSLEYFLHACRKHELLHALSICLEKRLYPWKVGEWVLSLSLSCLSGGGIHVGVIFFPSSVNSLAIISSMIDLLDSSETEIKIFSNYPPSLSVIGFLPWYLAILNTWFGE